MIQNTKKETKKCIMQEKGERHKDKERKAVLHEWSYFNGRNVENMEKKKRSNILQARYLYLC